MSAAVRIVQCLCPSRHCFLAIGYEPGITAAQERTGGTGDITLTEANAADYLKSIVEEMFADPDRVCGICRSREFTYEDRRSVFRSIEEAMPLLRVFEEAQRATRRMLDAGKN